MSLQRLQGCLLCIAVLVPTVIGVAVYAWFNRIDGVMSTVVIAIIAVVLIVLLVAAWVYPAKAYLAARWRVSDLGLEICSGVWWKHQIVIPHSRMQHSDIEQGPVQRFFDLATLVIHTAGTKDSSVSLDGLDLQTAERLRESLVTYDRVGKTREAVVVESMSRDDD